jgi:hypothetical protein
MLRTNFISLFPKTSLRPVGECIEIEARRRGKVKH